MTLPGIAADSETRDVKDVEVLVTIIDHADAAQCDSSANDVPPRTLVETYEVTGVTPGICPVATPCVVTTLNASDVPVTISSSAGGPDLRHLMANQRNPSNDLRVVTSWHPGFEPWANSNSILPRSPSS